MRVLVVDDSAFMRRAVCHMLGTDPTIEVVGAAKNGKEGLEMANILKPDVITMDIEMPVMDGIEALQQIMKQCPTKVLMLSSLTTDGSHAALRALNLGAADVMAKDVATVSMPGTSTQHDLVTRVQALGRAGRISRTPTQGKPVSSGPKSVSFSPGQFDVICIGSSTGGPPILERVLHPLPQSFQIPVIIAQHMPEVFTKTMSDRLNKDCAVEVVHAENHMPVQPGKVYIAPGGQHTHLKRSRSGGARWELIVNNEPIEALYKPGVDALFQSAAKHVGAQTLAIVMTGIGHDGLKGASELHACGGSIIAQSEESCVVYGMPKGVTEKNLIIASLDPDAMAAALLALAPRVAKAG